MRQLTTFHPWYDEVSKINDGEIYGEWLTPLNEENIEFPSFLIINGWMAEVEDNIPFINLIKDIITVFSYDARGIGKSTKEGSMTVKQAAIDMNYIFMEAIERRNKLAKLYHKKPGKLFIMGSCIGVLPVAAAYASKLPIIDEVDGVVLISPISKFKPNFLMKCLIFVPPAFITFCKKYLARPILNYQFDGNSDDVKKLALKRIQRIHPYATTKHAREYIWKGEVSKAWKYIEVPTIILVGPNDPIAPKEASKEIFYKLKAPLWIELSAPSHLLMEYNIDYLRKNFSNFMDDPLLFYENNKVELVPK